MDDPSHLQIRGHYECQFFFAEYSDGSRYQVVYDPGERQTYLRTTSGNKMDVPNLVNGASFARYDFHYVPQPGLRACDWAQNVSRFTRTTRALDTRQHGPPHPRSHRRSRKIFVCI